MKEIRKQRKSYLLQVCANDPIEKSPKTERENTTRMGRDGQEGLCVAGGRWWEDRRPS